MKPDKVVFMDDKLEGAFNQLKEIDPVKKAIKKAVRDIQEDSSCGRNVKKELIPRQLIQKYGITNLWIYNCPSSWRLLYSLTNKENISLIAVVLDWMNHKQYERLFKFT